MVFEKINRSAQVLRKVWRQAYAQLSAALCQINIVSRFLTNVSAHDCCGKD